jgi:Tfp pilus assembly protein PilO
MNKNRLSLIVALVVSAAVLAGGWFLGVQPQLAQASVNEAQQAGINETNDKNRVELKRLSDAYSALDATKSQLDALRSSVPATPDTEPFVRSLSANALASGVQVSNLSLGEPTAYVPTADTSADTATPSASATADPSAAVAPLAPNAHTDAAITASVLAASNFSVIPVTVAVDGSFDQALAFTKSVQAGPRLFLVTGIAAASTDDAPPMEGQSWSLSGSIYVLADPSGTEAPASDG